MAESLATGPAVETLSPLASWLAHARLEVMPFAPVVDELRALPPTRVTVTCSPRHGVDHTVEFAVDIVGLGHRAVPHIAANLVRSRSHLSEILQRMRETQITEALVIGGDAASPIGPYRSTMQLLLDIASDPARPSAVGIGAYPEGHPKVDHAALIDALLQKQAVATHVTTQLCFSAVTIRAWLESIRSAGVVLPVYIGLPGAVQRKKLLEISMRVGVGGSIRYLGRNASVLKGLTGQRSFDPRALANSLAAECSSADLGIAGLHVFTFNEVARTSAWLIQQCAAPGLARPMSRSLSPSNGSRADRQL